MFKLLRNVAVCAIPAIAMALPMQAKAWKSQIDCEDGAANTLPANRTGAFWGTNTRYSTEQAAGGKQSCKFSIKRGSEGWPSSGGPLEWGGIFDLPTPLKVGEELWVRLSLFVPNGFQIVSNSGQLKFIRLHTRTSSANTGCLDLLMGDPNVPLWDPVARKDTYPPYDLNFEGRPGLTMVGTRPTDNVQFGKWETYEVYVRLDSVSQDGGGMGVTRIWKNNKLLANATGQVGAADKTGVIDAVYLFTYWNGTSPADQYLYMDDLTMTNERPANRDASGFYYLGGAVTSGPSPRAPTDLSVQ